jgi:hypothetical protein
MDLGEVEWVVWTGMVWLRIGATGELLWMLKGTFGFARMPGSSGVAVELAASPIKHSSMQLILGECILLRMYSMKHDNHVPRSQLLSPV